MQKSDIRLAVLLHADIVNSTALVQENKQLAHSRFQRAYTSLSNLVSKHYGETLEIRGDALVASFQLSSDAIAAAVNFQLQQNTNNLNDDLLPITIRIGIAMGEVVIADRTVTGAGVVIAQRLEQLAPPGGVCIQNAVYETLPENLPYTVRELGECKLKGFERPTRAYLIAAQASTDQSLIIDKNSKPNESKPGIAVLPFANLSNDPEQEFFGDGISEDIITALSKVSNLMVISWLSTSIYKGKQVDIRQVGSEQGVIHVLQGSIRKSGDRIRLSAQLIDTQSGRCIWAERFDRRLDDIFSVQDELMREIVVALDVKLGEGEQVRIWSHGTTNIEAWQSVRLSSSIILGSQTSELPYAYNLLQQALQLDPNYAIAWVMLGWYHQNFADVANGLKQLEVVKSEVSRMRECANKAIELDPDCADAYSVLAMAHMEDNEYDEAIECAEKSIQLAPGNAENLTEASVILTKCGFPERALDHSKKALKLSPMFRAGFLRGVGLAQRFCGDLGAAELSFREAIKRQPDILSGYVNLASILGEMNQIDAARNFVQKITQLSPGFTIQAYSRGLSYKNPDQLKQIVDGLAKAGLPFE